MADATEADPGENLGFCRDNMLCRCRGSRPGASSLADLQRLVGQRFKLIMSWEPEYYPPGTPGEVLALLFHDGAWLAETYYHRPPCESHTRSVEQDVRADSCLTPCEEVARERCASDLYRKYRKDVSRGPVSPNSSKMPPTRRANDNVTGHFPRMSAVFQFIRVRLSTS